MDEKPSDSAVEVIEVGPALIHQQVTAVQSVLQVANQIIELTPLDELIALEGFLEDLALVSKVIRELRGLAWDIGNLDGQFERLFHVEGLPDTMAGRLHRKNEVTQLALEMRHDAMRAQTLVNTLLRTVDRLLRLMQSLRSVIGNLQVSTAISQGQQKIAQLLAEDQLARTVHERAEAFDAAEEHADIETLRKINHKIWQNWPGMAR